MRHTRAYRLSNSLSCYASCDARQTQPKQSRTSPWEHTRSLSHHLRRLLRSAAPSETTSWNPRFGTKAARTSVIWKESPHQCRTQTNPNTTHRSGQVSDESLTGAALAFFTAQMSARDWGENTGFLAFLLLFPAEITVARANISTVTQLASTIPCRGRRKKRISIGEKKFATQAWSLRWHGLRSKHTHNPTLVKLLLYLIMAGMCLWLPSTKATRWKSWETETSPSANLIKRCKKKSNQNWFLKYLFFTGQFYN